MSDLVTRTWNGPFGNAFLPDMSILRVGQPYQISAEQAESGHWLDPNATSAPTPPAPSASPFSSPSSSPSATAPSTGSDS